MKKEVKKEVKEEVAEVKEAPVADVAPETPSKADFKALIASYKEQNPKKYEAKKEVLEAKLKAMK